MDNSETSNSEVSSQRKEMKGPSFSFDPKIFLSKKEDKNQVNEDKNTNNLEKACCIEKTCEKTQINKEEVKEKELNPREKLKQKLQMQKMMRQNKGTLKRMLDSKIKS